jgi:hypothetical protein
MEEDTAATDTGNFPIRTYVRAYTLRIMLTVG